MTSYLPPLKSSLEQYLNLTLPSLHYRISLQLKPSGAIFIDSFNQTSSSLDMDYTIVANDLVLYYLNNPYNEDFSAGFDTHQRSECYSIACIYMYLYTCIPVHCHVHCT